MFDLQEKGFTIIDNIFTIRIHLEYTDENNEALKVPRGGVMVMRPLLMHASGRTVNGSRRRVLHIEFSNRSLPNGLSWAETYFPFSQPHAS